MTVDEIKARYAIQNDAIGSSDRNLYAAYCKRKNGVESKRMQSAVFYTTMAGAKMKARRVFERLNKDIANGYLQGPEFDLSTIRIVKE